MKTALFLLLALLATAWSPAAMAHAQALQKPPCHASADFVQVDGQDCCSVFCCAVVIPVVHFERLQVRVTKHALFANEYLESLAFPPPLGPPRI